ncbi:uncharacterized protein NDAI_0B02030 [Naumovozyma dairenensis CBS 421]|uniref:Uncharacterized protein n=1 Tax=Naumovozyma dairenensis (strain ATCC 10597 / BCRC 20456 / CBS 421 / NBRC 0211 / NRRL Y-12639) TaxID=1071378 RepID=G0W627_NAUDC|nr:hypothetical protein NDAI_0B02030 [Naumovozyma dairenensis CBS 421]CCD23238.1 hypothetical protein NDAI_0B02030 [Naumovozyma dairenensis CBS 421]
MSEHTPTSTTINEREKAQLKGYLGGLFSDEPINDQLTLKRVTDHFFIDLIVDHDFRLPVSANLDLNEGKPDEVIVERRQTFINHLIEQFEEQPEAKGILHGLITKYGEKFFTFYVVALFGIFREFFTTLDHKQLEKKPKRLDLEKSLSSFQDTYQANSK